MGVVIDTSVWSIALRRKRPDAEPVAEALARTLLSQPVMLLGIVRMELLSGIASVDFLKSQRKELRNYPHQPLEIEDYEMATDFRTACLRKGLQGSLADFLVCAAAVRREFPSSPSIAISNVLPRSSRSTYTCRI